MASKKSIEEIIQKNYPEFEEAVSGLGVSDLEARLMELAKGRQATREAKEIDDKLEQASALKSELEAPYRDAFKAIDDKSRYLTKLIGEKGGKTAS